jgi:hypothetical protein
MKEGWLDDDYIILFEERSSSLTEAYAIQDFLPSYKLVGLRGWDDFIVQDHRGVLFTVPVRRRLCEVAPPGQPNR